MLPEGCKCQQNGGFEAFRGREDARFPDRIDHEWPGCFPFVDAHRIFRVICREGVLQSIATHADLAFLKAATASKNGCSEALRGRDGCPFGTASRETDGDENCSWKGCGLILKFRPHTPQSALRFTRNPSDGTDRHPPEQYCGSRGILLVLFETWQGSHSKLL